MSSNDTSVRYTQRRYTDVWLIDLKSEDEVNAARALGLKVIRHDGDDVATVDQDFYTIAEAQACHQRIMAKLAAIVT